jgi:hypothetical protein
MVFWTHGFGFQLVLCNNVQIPTSMTSEQVLLTQLMRPRHSCGAFPTERNIWASNPRPFEIPMRLRANVGCISSSGPHKRTNFPCQPRFCTRLPLLVNKTLLTSLCVRGSSGCSGRGSSNPEGSGAARLAAPQPLTPRGAVPVARDGDLLLRRRGLGQPRGEGGSTASAALDPALRRKLGIGM